MIYCISDIHGDYEKYKNMLEKIDLGADDTLYVLGDIVDRGEKPIEILRDMMTRANVIPLIGNHEYMAMHCLSFLMTEITDESLAVFDGEKMRALTEWMCEGGTTTIEEFRRLSLGEKHDILDYLGEFSACEEVAVGGNSYVLVHAGLQSATPKEKLDEYELYEMIFSPPDYSKPYYPDKYLVTGHLPTRNIPENPNPDRIFRANNHIAIDCGCGFGGVLGAICLDTGEEFYT